VIAQSLGLPPVNLVLPAVPQPQQQPPAVLPHANSGISINDILRLAFDVAQHARQEDATGNLRGAFDLYTQALESFLIVYKEEKNSTLKEQLKATILEYTTRAEQIKELLNAPRPQNPMEANKRILPAGIRNEDIDGPYEQNVRKAHPGYSGAIDLRVRLPKRKFRLDEKVNIHIEVDNQSGRPVEVMKCYLICTVDSYYWKSPDAQERKSESKKTIPREYNFGKIFPLMHGGRFEGDFEYELGPRLKATERKDPTTLTREYVLVVKAHFNRPWKPLKTFTPITILP
jgi:hypothetical protein